MDSGEIPSLLIRISLRDPTSRMGTTIRTMGDHMIKAQIIHPIEAMEIDLEMNLSTIRKETGEKMEDVLVLHRRKGATFHTVFHTANQEVINQTILPSADLTINL